MWSSIHNKPFTGFPERCQEESVPSLLLAPMNMILEGPSTKDQMEQTQASVAYTCHFPNADVQQCQTQADVRNNDIFSHCQK